jgi:GNAT superfamily N-acetyltransferase
MDIAKTVKNNIKILRLPFNLLEDAKSFCLSVIKEVYDYHYQKEWAYDLDYLFKTNDFYTDDKKGLFVIALINDEIVATAAIRSLNSAPDISEKLKDRFINTKEVAIINRVYVKKEYRGQGVGKKIYDFLENEALFYNYSILYLNASKKTDALSFWKKNGYQDFLTEPDIYQTTHLEKYLLI